MADWWMSDGEILNDYRLAKDRVVQFEIIAQLNDVSFSELGKKMVMIGAMTENEVRQTLSTLKEIRNQIILSKELENDCMNLYNQKYSDCAIAQILGLNRSTVLYWRRKNKIPPNDPAKSVCGRFYSHGKKKRRKMEV